MAKSRMKKVLDAVKEVFSDGQGHSAADHSAAVMAAVRALFVSGSEWEDLRLAGDDGKSHLPKDLAQLLAELFAGKIKKLNVYDVKHPEKTLILDKTLLSDPKFAREIADGLPGKAPAEPSAFKRWMNTLFGSYQEELDKYQREKTLHDAKKMMARGKEQGRDQLPLPEEMQALEKYLCSKETSEKIEKAEKIAAEEQQAAQMQIQMDTQQEEREVQEEFEEETLSPAQRRRREALATLNRDDAGRSEIVDAVAVLLTCQAVRGQTAVENSEERFGQAVGKMKKQPSFLELTREPDSLRAWLQGKSPQRMENELLHKLKAMGQTLAIRQETGERKKTAPAAVKAAPQKAPPVRVHQLVLTMDRHTGSSDKKK